MTPTTPFLPPPPSKHKHKKKKKSSRRYCSSSSFALLSFLLFIIYLMMTIVVTQHYNYASTSTSSTATTTTRGAQSSASTLPLQIKKSEFVVSSSSSSMSKKKFDRKQVPSSAISTTTTTTTTTNNNTTATLVIQVRGEMGNHLQKIAHGYGLKWYAASIGMNDDGMNNDGGTTSTTTAPFLNIHLRVRHLKKQKWMTARDDVVTCFANFHNLDYESGHQPDFVKYQKAHSQWLPQQQQQQLQQQNHATTTIKNVQDIYRVRNSTKEDIEIGLRAMKMLAERPNKPYAEYPIVVLGGPMRNVLIDKYYDDYRKLFEFETTMTMTNNNNNNDGSGGSSSSCCALLPEPDEVVFYFRNFAKELSLEEQRSRGFEEMDPYRVVNLLMKDLQVGQKIAMTTRFGPDEEPVVQEYLNVFQKHGFQPRLIVNQTGVQDFCFLLHAQQELIGVAKSTYARWAAYLGNAQKVQLYALDNPGSQEFISETMRYKWSHPEIQRRIQWPVFPSV